MHLESKHARIGVVLFLSFVMANAAWGPGIIAAQTTPSPTPVACAQLLPNIEQHLSVDCKATNRDQVCYGNRVIAVNYVDASNGPEFAKAGDIVPLNTIKSITAGPLNPDRGEWGVAVMKVQAQGLERTAAGQVVTFILYGDTTLTNATREPVACSGTITRSTYLRAKPGLNEPLVQLFQVNATVKVTGRLADSSWVYAESQGKSGWLFARNLKLDCEVNGLAVNDPSAPAPSMPGLNAFYFSTGIGKSTCVDIPPAGLFVQSPKGLKVSFKANGANITMGSSFVMYQCDPSVPDVICLAVEDGGVGACIPGGRCQSCQAGQEMRMRTRKDANGQPQFIGFEPPDCGNYTRPVTGQHLPVDCQMAQALGLVLSCDVVVPPTATPTRLPPPPAKISTPLPDRCDPPIYIPHYYCWPGGRTPCENDGVCHPGEQYSTCPKDCPFAPIPSKKQCCDMYGCYPC